MSISGIKTGWWFGTWILWLSHHIGNIIIPTDFHSIIFQRGRYTTNQKNNLVDFWPTHRRWCWKAPGRCTLLSWVFEAPADWCFYRLILILSKHIGDCNHSLWKSLSFEHRVDVSEVHVGRRVWKRCSIVFHDEAPDQNWHWISQLLALRELQPHCRQFRSDLAALAEARVIWILSNWMSALPSLPSHASCKEIQFPMCAIALCYLLLTPMMSGLQWISVSEVSLLHWKSC